MMDTNMDFDTRPGAHRLMSDVLSLKTQRWLDGSKVTSMIRGYNIYDHEAKIYLLRELLTLVRRLPLKVFDDEEVRLRMMQAIQEALDTAIDEEEE